MLKMYEAVRFVSGTPQFRIKESVDEQAPTYFIYSQTDLIEDLTDFGSVNFDGKIIRTWDSVHTLMAADVLFSLISGEASIIRKEHDGYLYTQNYVKLVPDGMIEPGFLVYLLNHDRRIAKQFLMGLQGSRVLKYTLKQLKELEIPTLPPIEKQKIISDIYFKQLRLQAIRGRAAELETIILFQKLEEVT